ncbi:hypothetical protein C2S53_013608 [Perilla frutescens var. hirtella]|uniref:Agenet domain-containing protein n=1 Tax=Perilla frutescens var. hirtella TaxID=608512 RepID=A0AAD4IYR4_PERFH|nr:hypothetical protein C2S53_013608 [Perilla frutescens var. hirtella]
MGGDAAANPLPLNQHQLQISPTGAPHTHRRTAARHQSFPVGSGVEVQTDEEDFKGVYFSATVCAPPISPKRSGRKKSRKLYVEYQNLLAHEDGSDRLREFVDVAFVRPVPPLQEISKGFQPDDVVDAFYKDGWWTGVVTRAAEGGDRFVVTFNNPPDELEFGLGELRAHLDWVNGSWVRPQRQSIVGLMFDVGRKVEVSFGREDFQDAWFPATIHQDLGNKTYVVEHNSAATDNNNGLASKATVNSLHIRPCPPLLKDKNFILLEKVDAFFDFGWWSGIITKRLEHSRYLVFFKQMKCDKVFKQSELRPHMEWKDGKWFTSQEPSIPFLDDGMCTHRTPENSSPALATAPVNNLADGASVATAPVNNSVDGKDSCVGKTQPLLISRRDHFKPLIPDNQKKSQVTPSLTKKRAYVSDSGSALSQLLKKFKEGNFVGTNKEEKVASHMEKSVDQTMPDLSSTNHPWEEKVQRKQRNSRTTQNASGKINSTSSSPGKNSAQILPELDFGEKEPDTTGNTGEVAQNDHAKRETEFPIIIGLQCAETGTSGESRSQHSNKKIFSSLDDQRQEVNNSPKDCKQSGIGDGSEKRRRGRPRKILVESIETLGTGNVEHTVVSPGDLNIKDDESQRMHEVDVIEIDASILDQEKMTANQERKANGQSGSGKRKMRVPKRMLATKHGEDDVEVSTRLGDDHSLKRGRKQITSGKIAVKVRDFVGAPGGKSTVVNRTVEVDKAFEPSNEFDNEPLSKWIEELHISSVIEGSRVLPLDTVVQSIVNGDNRGNSVVVNEATEKQPESSRQSYGLVDEGDAALTEPQSLLSVNNTVGVVLDGGTQKQSESGTQTASLVDKVSIIASEPQSLPSMKEATVLLDKDSEKQPENEARATAMVDKSSMIPGQPRSSVEKAGSAVLDEDNEKRPENGMALAPALVDKVAIVPSEPQNLPFVKNTVLWKTIESMEVFKRMPQNPHFRPLSNIKESSREGLAIGFMVTFSSVVERTSKLQPNDSISIMDDIKESLGELEKHGFDVRAVQDCVNELLAMKSIEEKLVNDVDTLNTQITEHNNVKTRVDREIEEINEHIQRLQRKLEQANSAKEKEEEDIAFLQVRLRETEESIKSVRSDFTSRVSSIL